MICVLKETVICEGRGRLGRSCGFFQLKERVILMKLTEILKQDTLPLSFEVFLPKTDHGKDVPRDGWRCGAQRRLRRTHWCRPLLQGCHGGGAVRGELGVKMRRRCLYTVSFYEADTSIFLFFYISGANKRHTLCQKATSKPFLQSLWVISRHSSSVCR